MPLSKMMGSVLAARMAGRTVMVAGAAPTPCFYLFLFVHPSVYPPKNMGVTVQTCLALSGPIH